MKVDPELFQKALNNVVVNAIKYTPDMVRFQFLLKLPGMSTLGPVYRNSGAGYRDWDRPGKSGYHLRKTVSIGQSGIALIRAYHLQRRRPGLGLAIAAGIVKAHGGKIWAESPGYDEEKLPGSTFFIQIPLPGE